MAKIKKRPVFVPEEHMPIIEAAAKEGTPRKYIADKLGLTQSMFRKWRNRYPEIDTAILEGYKIAGEFRRKKAERSAKPRYCKWCGEMIDPEKVTNPRELYCCEDHRKRGIKASQAAYRQQFKQPKVTEREKEAPKKVVAVPMSEILRGMKETGLQYGDYVAKYCL